MKSGYDRIVKEVTTKRFCIRLIEAPSGKYCVIYDSSTQNKPVFSEMLADFNIANILFNKKLEELEGN